MRLIALALTVTLSLAVSTKMVAQTESGASKTFNLQDNEKTLIISALKDAQGNIGVAAKKLGISESALRRKMKQYQVNTRPAPEADAAALQGEKEITSLTVTLDPDHHGDPSELRVRCRPGDPNSICTCSLSNIMTSRARSFTFRLVKEGDGNDVLESGTVYIWCNPDTFTLNKMIERLGAQYITGCTFSDGTKCDSKALPLLRRQVGSP